VKAVVDTNTLISGLLWHGNPARVLDAVLDNRLELCLTDELLEELGDVLRRPRLAKQVAQRGLDVGWTCSFIRERSLMLYPAPLLQVPELRDRKDLPVLAAALTAAADVIITGDQDLLIMKSFAGIPILDAAQAVAQFAL
jgi:uncharacterized protein